MDLAEQVDPEEWHRIMDRFFAVLSEGIHRFEGTINQYTGDGIMALFGAPIAHEDHAQRACYAALALQENLRRYANELRLEKGINFSVRMGLNSGEVVVGKIGDDLRMDYTAQGHTASLAARMEQIAEPGKAYVTEHTARLVEGMFTLEDLGRVTVKGVKEPVRVYALEGVGRLRTRLEVSRVRGFSQFVGRDGEIGVIQSALDKALEGRGQIVGIVGEAGVGKSRLCLEFVGRCRAKGIFVNEGHCLAHGKTIPYLPILELWRSYFGITERDSDEEARRKIAGTLLLLGEDFLDVLPLVFEFLSVPDPERPAPRMDPEQKQRQMAEFLRRVVRLQSARVPTVLLIDDLHWIDRASDEVVAQLADAIEGSRSMVLVNFRPEYGGSWMKRSHYQQLPQLPLGSEGIEAMLSELLGTDPSVKQLKARIRQRTGGNPFFIEEVAQSLIESGALEGPRGRRRMVRPLDAVSIPSTVQVVLAARIDRLADLEKQLLQTASVIGKRFSESVLRKVAGLAQMDLAASLAALGRGEFIHEESLYPEVEYAFKHPLTQEVAYRSQLTERRRVMHAAVARAIEGSYCDKIEERASELAYHWENAAEALEAARWHRRAAEWASTRDPRAALDHWQRAQHLLDPLPESAEICELALRARAGILSWGFRFGLSEADAERLFQEGERLADRVGDPRQRLAIVFGYGSLRGFAGHLQEYLQRAREAVDLADRLNDVVDRAGARAMHGTASWVAGRLEEAWSLFEEGRVLLEGDKQGSSEIFAGFLLYLTNLLQRASVDTEAGCLGRGASTFAEAQKFAESFGSAEDLRLVTIFRTWLETRRGDKETALRYAARAMELCEARGSHAERVGAHVGLGEAQLLAEQWPEAQGVLARGLAIARENRTGIWFEPLLLAGRSRALLGLGKGAQALSAAEEAVSTAVRIGTRVWEITARLVLVKVLLRSPGASAADEINSELRRAKSLVEETGGRTWEPFIHAERAELARLAGDEATRQRELREAHRLFLEIDAPIRAAEVAKELGL
jgi:adenylate cyclase